MRLARSLAELVVVYIHWGSELLDWPNTGQREAAGWLIQNGADVIVGHHPHVVQTPECVRGRPVFFSLGNHVFDQR
jgi:poly-gamma-glutamate synthesis protein (capsule biosynthesis protein)